MRFFHPTVQPSIRYKIGWLGYGLTPYLLTYYEPEMGFMRQPNGKSLDKDGPRPKDTHSTRHSSTPVA